MGRLILAIIVLVGWYHQTIEALECATPNEDKIRVFDTITHFQGNTVPFSPMKGGWKGSTVEFSFSTINKLEKNDFVAHDSESIITLKLSGKQIKEIDDGAFISLSCLHGLFLDHNNITKLTKNTFQNLEKLTKLDLSYNKLEILKDLTFSNLRRLQSLNLGNNQIKTVEILAFVNLTSLEYLNLEHNEIKTIDDDLFSSLSNLSSLILSWNTFFDVKLKWSNLNRLQNLELAGNNLNIFFPHYNITFPNLKSLNLSFNSLTLLNVRELRKHFPNLELIDLNSNLWFCDDLELIVHELNDARIKFSSGNLSRVGVHGIACDEISRYSSTTSTSTTSTTRKNEVWVNHGELERYVDKKIEDNNQELRSSIASIRSVSIFAFSLLCVYIVFEVLYRTKVCMFVYNKFRGGNDLYVDDGTDVENFRLLHR